MQRRSTQEVQVDGRTLTLSNLDKALYRSGFTKGQVIDYYIRVSERLLPHLKDRPVTLKRYPNGVTAAHFYEKNAPRFTPPWVRRVAVPRKTGGADISYIIIDNLVTLVWSANMANLEIHPFLHRAPALDRPTVVAFDLDPGEGADILSCAEVAFLLKRALEKSGLRAFPKVSGSKGMQVYAPLNRQITYADTQPFALALAESLEREHPENIVSKMAKARRKGKVFIDWSQNSDFKTTVAVYSLRAKQSTPFVSMPVSWEELRNALERRDSGSLSFDPDAALARLAKKGDVFEPVLSLKQKLPRGLSLAAGGRRSSPAA